MFRHKNFLYSEVCPLHSPLCVVQQKTYRGCPLQHDIGWEQILRALAVTSSCVRRMQDKGCQGSIRCRKDGKRQRDVWCVCARGKGEARPFQKLAGSFISPFIFFYGSAEVVNYLMSYEWHQYWNAMQLAGSEMEASTTWSFSSQPELFFDIRNKNCVSKEKENQIRIHIN